MNKTAIIIIFVGAIMYCYAGEIDEIIYDPIQTPIYVGTTLFCSKIVYNIDEVPCDSESRLVAYSSNTEDTIRGILNFRVYFDIMSASPNKELIVKDIKDIEIIYCDRLGFDMNTLIPVFYNKLLDWHWWLGDYMNPLTMYPQQIWTIKYIVIPEHQR